MHDFNYCSGGIDHVDFIKFLGYELLNVHSDFPAMNVFLTALLLAPVSPINHYWVWDWIVRIGAW